MFYLFEDLHETCPSFALQGFAYCYSCHRFTLFFFYKDSVHDMHLKTISALAYQFCSKLLTFLCFRQ